MKVHKFGKKKRVLLSSISVNGLRFRMGMQRGYVISNGQIIGVEKEKKKDGKRNNKKN